MRNILIGAAAGLVATFIMDFFGAIIRKKGWIQGITPQMLGRWILGLPTGRLIHKTIIQSPEVHHELTIAFVGHYLIGAILGGGYSFFLTKMEMFEQAQHFAFAFGFLTNFFPWFILFPALGFGWFGLQGPQEMKLFRTSTVNHCLYGAGLFLSFAICSL